MQFWKALRKGDIRKEHPLIQAVGDVVSNAELRIDIIFIERLINGYF